MILKNHHLCALAIVAVQFLHVALAEDTEKVGQWNNSDSKKDNLFADSALAEDTEKAEQLYNNYSEKPNIVIILADDVGTGDLPFYWPSMDSSKVQMPNLQKLAEKGVLFKDAHSSPLCAPSRYTTHIVGPDNMDFGI
jgi:hypothetical protein